MTGQSVLACEKYIFDPTAKTITFNMVDFNPAKIKQITNITTGTIIYCPQLQLLGTFNNNILTLVYDTTSMSSNTCLQILYDWEANYHKNFDESFGMTVASGVDTRQMSLISQGTGQTVSQSGGNLLVALGTTTNAETIIRGNVPFSRNAMLDITESRTQNHANNRIQYGLYDVIGDGLAISVASSTSATVTVPNTSRYYNKLVEFLSGAGGLGSLTGMSMAIGALGNVTGAIPARYNIASASYTVDSVSLTFTVASWTGGSSGTCTLYGWNAIDFYHDGATVANMYFDCIRYGRNSNLGYVSVATSQAAATTAIKFRLEKFTEMVAFSDSVVTTLGTFTQRATRITSLIPEEFPLYPQMIFRNGTVAPTATTATVSAITCRECNPTSVSIDDVQLKTNSTTKSLPVVGTVAVSSLPTVAGVTTVTTVTNQTGYTAASTLLPATRVTLVSTASTNATLVKNAAGNIYSGSASNNGTTPAYLKIFNLATAPTMGTSSPIINVMIPSGQTISLGDVVGVHGARFAAGISYAITGGSALLDTTAVAAGQVTVNINYV